MNLSFLRTCPCHGDMYGRRALGLLGPALLVYLSKRHTSGTVDVQCAALGGEGLPAALGPSDTAIVPGECPCQALARLGPGPGGLRACLPLCPMLHPATQGGGPARGRARWVSRAGVSLGGGASGGSKTEVSGGGWKGKEVRSRDPDLQLAAEGPGPVYLGGSGVAGWLTGRGDLPPAPAPHLHLDNSTSVTLGALDRQEWRDGLAA